MTVEGWRFPTPGFLFPTPGSPFPTLTSLFPIPPPPNSGLPSSRPERRDQLPKQGDTAIRPTAILPPPLLIRKARWHRCRLTSLRRSRDEGEGGGCVKGPQVKFHPPRPDRAFPSSRPCLPLIPTGAEGPTTKTGRHCASASRNLAATSSDQKATLAPVSFGIPPQESGRGRGRSVDMG